MPRKYESQILEAIESAPTYASLEEAVTLDDNHPMKVLHDLDDYTPVTFESDGPRPGEVLVRNLGELLVLYNEFLVVADRQEYASPSEVTSQVTHEGEHAYAARQLGCLESAAIFGMAILRANDFPGKLLWNVFHRPTNWQTNKLGVAAVSAYPRQPSDGDKNDVKVMGYASIDELARRIRVHNQRYSYEPIPVPLSSIDAP